ncbi:MAG: hypothetical protein ACLQEQ_00400 [Nitrososphaerales archaeon]
MKPLGVVAVLLATALAFAFLCMILIPTGFAVFFPPATLVYSDQVPNGPVCTITSHYISCPAMSQASANLAGDVAFYNGVYWFNVLSWCSQTCADVAIGLATLAVLFYFMSVVAQRVKRLDRRLPVPRPIRDLALLGAVSGLAIFALLAFLDVVTTPIRIPGPLILSNVLSANVHYYGGPPPISLLETIGQEGFGAFIAATCCVFVYRLTEGVWTALGKALALFAAPVLVAFEVALLVFTPINMPIQATEFLVGSPLGAVLTNWFVLVVSSGLFVLGLARSRLGLWSLSPQDSPWPPTSLSHLQSVDREDSN